MRLPERLLRRWLAQGPLMRILIAFIVVSLLTQCGIFLATSPRIWAPKLRIVSRPMLLEYQVVAKYRQYLRNLTSEDYDREGIDSAPWAGVLFGYEHPTLMMGVNNVMIALVSAATFASATMRHPVLYIARYNYIYLPGHNGTSDFAAVFDFERLRRALAGVGVDARLVDDTRSLQGVYNIPNMFPKRHTVAFTTLTISEITRRLRTQYAAHMRPGMILHIGPANDNVLQNRENSTIVHCWACFSLERLMESHVALVAFQNLRFRTGLRVGAATAAKMKGFFTASSVTMGLHFRIESDWKNQTEAETLTTIRTRTVAKTVQLMQWELRRNSNVTRIAIYVASGIAPSSPYWQYLATHLLAEAPVKVVLFSKYTPRLRLAPVLAGLDPISVNGVDQEILYALDSFSGECDSSLSFHVMLNHLLANRSVYDLECWNKNGYSHSNSQIFPQAYFLY